MARGMAPTEMWASGDIMGAPALVANAMTESEPSPATNSIVWVGWNAMADGSLMRWVIGSPLAGCLTGGRLSFLTKLTCAMLVTSSSTGRVGM